MQRAKTDFQLKLQYLDRDLQSSKKQVQESQEQQG